MNPIDTVFAELRKANARRSPVRLGGDPDVCRYREDRARTGRLWVSPGRNGFPFSDPIADGPVIQAAYTRALDRGFESGRHFNCVDGLKRATEPIRAPLVGMVSYSLIHRRGPGAFLGGRRRPICRLIVPDLPAEESEGFADKSRLRLNLIMLVDANTPPAGRSGSSNSRPGSCTAERRRHYRRARPAARRIAGALRQLRGMTDLPLCVGFRREPPNMCGCSAPKSTA